MFQADKWKKLSPPERLKKILFTLHRVKWHQLPLAQVQQMIECTNLLEYQKYPIPSQYAEVDACIAFFQAKFEDYDPFAPSYLFDLPQTDSSTLPMALLLDNIRTPFNVGAIMRTAEAMGVNHIYLSGISPLPESNAKVQRAAKQVDVPTTYLESPTKFLEEWKQTQGKVIAIEKTQHSIELLSFVSSLEFDRPYLYILGNEEFGVHPDLLSLCHQVVHIPMLGKKNSLNVSVAAGIALYLIASRYSA